jgi:hypothetical protein
MDAGSSNAFLRMTGARVVRLVDLRLLTEDDLVVRWLVLCLAYTAVL